MAQAGHPTEEKGSEKGFVEEKEARELGPLRVLQWVGVVLVRRGADLAGRLSGRLPCRLFRPQRRHRHRYHPCSDVAPCRPTCLEPLA